MTPLEITDTADAHFSISLHTGHAGDLRHDAPVNLEFTDNSTRLSVAGTTFFDGTEDPDPRHHGDHASVESVDFAKMRIADDRPEGESGTLTL